LVPQVGERAGALPKSAHPEAKKALAEIWSAEDRRHALDAATAFAAAYGAKFPKAAAKITDDLDELVAFYDYPAEHWIHLRTTDEIVNPSAGCRRWLPSILVLPRPPEQREIAGPEPGSRRDACSAARTALTPVRTGVGFPAVDVVRPRREVQG